MARTPLAEPAFARIVDTVMDLQASGVVRRTAIRHPDRVAVSAFSRSQKQPPALTLRTPIVCMHPRLAGLKISLLLCHLTYVNQSRSHGCIPGQLCR